MNLETHFIVISIIFSLEIFNFCNNPQSEQVYSHISNYSYMSNNIKLIKYNQIDVIHVVSYP